MSHSLLGIGLRSRHLQEFAAKKPKIGFIEVHSENYLHCGGVDFECLKEISDTYPVSLHGIGMSLGSAAGIDKNHLEHVCKLVDVLQPILLSDHLSWSSAGGYFFPDLIPFPFNDESLEVFVKNVELVQKSINRFLTVENPSSYFTYKNSIYSEPEFINMLCRETGANLLLDLNNVYISAINNDFSAEEYVDALDLNIVKEMHVSGHSIKDLGGGKRLYIDSHDTAVIPEVWRLYEYAIKKFGVQYTVLEWDSNLPTLDELINHAYHAERFMNENIPSSVLM